MKEEYRQVKLQDGSFEMVTNLPDHRLLRLGSSLTLRDEPNRWWKVIWVAETTRPKSELRTNWDNNI